MNKEKDIRLAICAAGELWGGEEQFVLTFCSLLQQRNIKAIVILFNEGLLQRRLLDAGVQVNIIRRRFKYDISSVFDIQHILGDHAINVMHLHGYKATILGSIAAKLAGIKVIKTMHGKLEPFTGWGYLKMAINTSLEKFFSRHLLDRIVFVSRDTLNLSGKDYLRIPHSVIYNGIEPLRISEDSRNNGIDKSYFNIGIIGRISPVKGHIHLFRAMERLSHYPYIRLLVFGEGPLKERYMEYCRDTGLSERVFFMGFKKDIHNYMGKLDLLVMPSIHEGLPYTLLEAMFLNLPVIASAVGGLKEAIDNDVDGILVPPKDEKALACEIERVYKNTDLRKDISQNAKRKVLSKFLASDMVDKYIALYVDTLSQRTTV